MTFLLFRLKFSYLMYIFITVDEFMYLYGGLGKIKPSHSEVFSTMYRVLKSNVHSDRRHF